MMNGTSQQPRSGGSSDPGSFVVLPSPVGQLHGPRSIAEFQASLSQCDMSLEEAMHKVVDLMKENQDLKETVKGHTELMKKQFQVMADLKAKWNEDQEEFTLRHKQAKEVVTGLKDSLKEKDSIIDELKHQLSDKQKALSEKETASMETGTVRGPEVNEVVQAKLKQLESDNQALLQSKVDLGKQVQDLTDEIIELKEKYTGPAEPEEVVINLDRESASMQAHLISMENKRDSATLQLGQMQKKVDVLQEEVTRHIQTIEALNQELTETRNVKEEIENEYIKLTEEHGMLQNAIKQDKEMMKESHASIKKIQESYQKLLTEKQELLALNNQMALQIQSLKGSPISDKSIDNMISSPVEETATSDVIFQRDQYLKQVEMRKKKDQQDLAVTAGLMVGELTSPISDFETVSLTGRSADLFVNQNKEKPGEGEEIQLEERQKASSSTPTKRRSREDQAVSDLLLQLQEERSKVTEMMSKINLQSSQIAELTAKLRDREEQLAISSKSVSKLSLEREEEREQLLNRIELLKSELDIVQEEQERPLESINTVQTLQMEIQGLITDLKESENKYFAVLETSNSYKERCIDLQAKIQMYQEELETQRNKDDQLIEAMRTTITSIEAQLLAERQEIQRKNYALQELRTSHDQLCSDYHELYKNIEDRKDSKDSAREIDRLRREYQNQVDTLTAKLITTEEALMTQREEFMQMRNKWKEMQSQVETVPVLQAQAEVFKCDFEAERKAREDMASERDRLSEEVENLQHRNQQLLEEMQAMSATQVSELQRRHGYAVYGQPPPIAAAMHTDPDQIGPTAQQLLQMREAVQQQRVPPDLIAPEPGDITTRVPPVGGEWANERERSPFDVQRTVAANAGNTRLEDNEEPQIFRCPKCNISCPDYDTLNLHVNECLDQD